MPPLNIEGFDLRVKYGEGQTLIFMPCSNPSDDPTSGSGVCARDWAQALTELGFKVVIIEANNKDNAYRAAAVGNGQRLPFEVLSIPFDGTQHNPVFDKDPTAYRAYSNIVPMPYLAFRAATRSSRRFTDASPKELQAYYNLFGWMMLAASLVYGPPDMVWAHHAWIHSHIGSSVPVAFTVHGPCIATDGGSQETRYRKIVLEGVRRAFAAAAISEQEKRNIIDFGCDKEKVHLVLNGFNNRVFHPRTVTKTDLVGRSGQFGMPDMKGIDPSNEWIVFTGRAVYFKGIDLLLEAAAKVMRERPNVRVLVLGAGDNNRVQVGTTNRWLDHHTLAADLGIADRVHFLGPVSQDTMADFMAASNAVVLPSREEPFGLVAIESMAVGKPPILTSNGGFLTIIGRYSEEDFLGRETVLDVARLVVPDDVRLRKNVELTLQEIDGSDINQDVKDLALLILRNPESWWDQITHDENDEDFERILTQAQKLVTNTITRISRQRSIDSIANAIRVEMDQTPESISARSAAAAKFALEHFSVKARVADSMVPIIRTAIAEGQRSRRWGLRYTPTVNSSPRLARLNSIPVDKHMSRRFRELRGSEGLPGSTQAWFRFFETVIMWLARVDMAYPLDMSAMHDPFQNPWGLLSEMARAANVHTAAMHGALMMIAKAPWHRVVPPPPYGAGPIEDKGTTQSGNPSGIHRALGTGSSELLGAESDMALGAGSSELLGAGSSDRALGTEIGDLTPEEAPPDDPAQLVIDEAQRGAQVPVVTGPLGV